MPFHLKVLEQWNCRDLPRPDCGCCSLQSFSKLCSRLKPEPAIPISGFTAFLTPPHCDCRRPQLQHHEKRRGGRNSQIQIFYKSTIFTADSWNTENHGEQLGLSLCPGKKKPHTQKTSGASWFHCCHALPGSVASDRAHICGNNFRESRIPCEQNPASLF